ncbi:MULTISPECIES: sensor histidine kinase [Bacillales]|uniref:histidine kinase n=1 Tax=Lysinibacillus louembei TaxID=1470088 RepID=A0ABZ0S2Q4_9BACI|nr:MULTISPECIES: sensor histidine kinase [Bacillales]MCT6925113.1 sensor histidine kinase [Metasolibacillus sp.]MCT6941317.1 sensor histidine kinase [Metasolibacillus sp.]WPK13596.1 sensor histidine kinase [Lysinibacillus louembei]
MQSWYSIIPKSPWLSIYIWIIFCIMPFFFIVRSLSIWHILLGTCLILLYFVFHRFSFKSRNGLVYMWLSFQMVLNVVMTLLFGYVYLSLFTAFFIGNIRRPVGFYIMYGLHIGFTVLSIVAGYFIYLEMFLAQTPFIILAVIGVVLLPFTLYTRNKQENLEGELETARERISELIIHEERQRIARDLHDTLGQKLSMIGLKSDLAMRLVEKNPEQAKVEIKDIRHTASIALKEVRELVADMRAVRIEEELYRIEQILKAAEIELVLHNEGHDLNMPVLSENVVSMAMKEAVTNVVKHSKASRCDITIAQTDNEVIITIQDNGIGLSKRVINSGSGLKGMQERLEFINGTVELMDDNGTLLIIRVPLTITHQKGSESK